MIGDLVRHPDRRDDAVEREDKVEQEDLPDGRAEANAGARGVEQIVVRGRIDVVMDFLRGLPDEEEAAADQDEVAPGKAVARRP